MATLTKSNAQVSHTGSTTETTLASYTLAGGTLGANDKLKITTLWSRNSGVGLGVATARIKLDDGVNPPTTYYQNAVTGSTTHMQCVTYIYANNATNSQKGMAATQSTGVGNSTAPMVTSSIDTTNNLNIDFTALLASATDSLRLESYEIELQ